MEQENNTRKQIIRDFIPTLGLYIIKNFIEVLAFGFDPRIKALIVILFSIPFLAVFVYFLTHEQKYKKWILWVAFSASVVLAIAVCFTVNHITKLSPTDDTASITQSSIDTISTQSTSSNSGFDFGDGVFYADEGNSSELQGWGRIYYDNGNVFIGRLKKTPNNNTILDVEEGLLFYPDKNELYIGPWVDNKRTGIGAYYWRVNELDNATLRDICNEDADLFQKFTSQKIITKVKNAFINCPLSYYTGSFVNGLFVSGKYYKWKGTMQMPDDNDLIITAEYSGTYEGSFANDTFDGEGHFVFTNPDGLRFDGEFKEGRVWDGKYTYPNGKVVIIKDGEPSP